MLGGIILLTAGYYLGNREFRGAFNKGVNDLANVVKPFADGIINDINKTMQKTPKSTVSEVNPDDVRVSENDNADY